LKIACCGKLGSGAKSLDKRPPAFLCLTAAVSLALLCSADLRGQAPTAKSQDTSGELQVRISCSKAKPGVAIAEVSWAEQKSVSAGAGAAKPSQLEVTTVKNGFSTGAAVTVWPKAEGANIGAGMGASDHRIDPLRNLQVSPNEKGLGGAGQSLGVTKGASLNAVTIQNLQPGINYFWRLQRNNGDVKRPASVVMTTAPVCAVDYKK
jgi:hypothetical protein